MAAIDATFVLRFGLAVLFAANALVAWIDPDDFTSLVEDSGVGRLIDSQVVLWGIRVNDFLAALAVLFVWNRAGLDRPLPGRRGCDQARRDGLVAGDEEEPG